MASVEDAIVPLPPETGEKPPANVIPIQRSPKNQLNNAIGMFLFLVSWGITFLGLFVAYFVIRWRAHEWPPPGTPELPRLLPGLNTMIAVASSVTFDRAVRAARLSRPALVRRWLFATFVLGATFLLLQNLVWAHLWAAGLQLRKSNFAGLFYLLTWFHSLHVFAGLVIIAGLAPKAVRGAFTPRDHGGLRFGAWFWHFVTGVWFGVFFAFWVV